MCPLAQIPLDGFDPPFTITKSEHDDNALPSSHTCFNQVRRGARRRRVDSTARCVYCVVCVCVCVCVGIPLSLYFSNIISPSPALPPRGYAPSRINKQLVLPPFKSADVLRKKLLFAIDNGGGFHMT